ncbi:ADP-ribosylglycohydrolase family protein [Plesiocystis pacifica]|nr:ADP-ribosylglycohydrolase family protein [Plesiocystis pacifica]
MLAAIAGDMVGSVHEKAHIKRMNFALFGQNSSFTDDTVLTVAVADALVQDKPYAERIRHWAQAYPRRGYGGMFREWMARDDAEPYGSYGNGSAMRVSPVGWAFHRKKEVLDAAMASAAVTHDHPEGIKGAQAVALAIFLARKGADRKAIRAEIEAMFGYDLGRSIARIRPSYRFDVTCQGSVPEAIIAALEATSVEEAIRLAVSLGGDADTQACIAGGIAQARFGEVPEELRAEVLRRLDEPMRAVLRAFEVRFGSTGSGF